MLDDLRLELESLKEAMSPLEPDGEERRRLGAMAMDHALAYLEAVPDAPSNSAWSDVFERRLDPEFSEAGRDPADILHYVGRCVERPGFATTSPRFMAYIPGGGRGGGGRVLLLPPVPTSFPPRGAAPGGRSAGAA